MPNWLRGRLERNIANVEQKQKNNDTPESRIESTDKCVIGLGVDGNNEGFILVHLVPGHEETLANVLVSILSGVATEEILESIKENCKETGADYTKFAEAVLRISPDVDNIANDKEELYVKPSQIGLDSNA